VRSGRPDKRSSPRVPVSLMAHCRIGNRHVRDAVGDLSQGGLYLKTREAATVGTQVRMALALPVIDGPHICTLVGAVAWRELDVHGRQRGLGVAFREAEIGLTDRKSLAGFLQGRLVA
jgi:Tfp pilus assembly protein PilZ